MTLGLLNELPAHSKSVRGLISDVLGTSQWNCRCETWWLGDVVMKIMSWSDISVKMLPSCESSYGWSNNDRDGWPARYYYTYYTSLGERTEVKYAEAVLFCVVLIFSVLANIVIMASVIRWIFRVTDVLSRKLSLRFFVWLLWGSRMMIREKKPNRVGNCFFYQHQFYRTFWNICEVESWLLRTLILLIISFFFFWKTGERICRPWWSASWSIWPWPIWSSPWVSLPWWRRGCRLPGISESLLASYCHILKWVFGAT
jgi:hypothetical protein